MTAINRHGRKHTLTRFMHRQASQLTQASPVPLVRYQVV